MTNGPKPAPVNPPKGRKRPADTEHVDHRVNQLGGFFEGKLNDLKTELVAEIKKATALPERGIDRLLMWAVRQRHTWALVAGFLLVGAILCSVVHAIIGGQAG